MSGLTSVRKTTFRHAFQLPGMDRPHAPGTFDLVIEKIALDLSWEAYKTACTLMITDGATTSAYPVSLGDVETALEADAAQDTDTGHS